MEKNNLIIKTFMRFNIELVKELYLKAKNSEEISKIYELEWNFKEEFSVLLYIETYSDYLVGYALQIEKWGFIKSYTISLEDVKILNNLELVGWLNENIKHYPNFTKYIYSLENLKLAIKNFG
jgi:hypothetical protein